jgi:hypothetical protein
VERDLKLQNVEERNKSIVGKFKVLYAIYISIFEIYKKIVMKKI